MNCAMARIIEPKKKRYMQKRSNVPKVTSVSVMLRRKESVSQYATNGTSIIRKPEKNAPTEPSDITSATNFKTNNAPSHTP